MKKLLLIGLFAGMGGIMSACARPATTPSSRPTPATGADASAGALSPQGAVDRFLASVREQDLQAMSMIWGTERGPARDNMPREELEKREIILQCYLKHDTVKVLGEATGENRRQVFEVQLTKGQLVRTTTLHTIKGPRGRWYVEKADIASLREFCSGV